MSFLNSVTYEKEEAKSTLVHVLMNSDCWPKGTASCTFCCLYNVLMLLSHHTAVHTGTDCDPFLLNGVTWKRKTSAVCQPRGRTSVVYMVVTDSLTPDDRVSLQAHLLPESQLLTNPSSLRSSPPRAQLPLWTLSLKAVSLFTKGKLRQSWDTKPLSSDC